MMPKALHQSVVQRVALARHRLVDAMILKPGLKLLVLVLPALVRMKDQTVQCQMLTHQALHLLMIDYQAAPSELQGNAAVAVAVASGGIVLEVKAPALVVYVIVILLIIVPVAGHSCTRCQNRQLR